MSAKNAGLPVGILPASTNDRYAGRPLAPRALLLLSILTIGPALIHVFLPDGGAGVIAGLDLSQNGAQIVGLFAWAGATQLVFGLTLLIVALRHRDFVPLMLALLLLEQSIISLNLWVLKPGSSGHRPPGAYGSLLAVPVLLGLLHFARSPRRVLS